MAVLTSTQKQFIKRVDFDRKLHDIFASKAAPFADQSASADITQGFESHTNLETSNASKSQIMGANHANQTSTGDDVAL